MDLQTKDAIRLERLKSAKVESSNIVTQQPLGDNEWTAFHLNAELRGSRLPRDAYATLKRLESAGIVESRGKVNLRTNGTINFSSHALEVFAVKDEIKK